MATRNELRRYAITDVPGARHGESGYHPDGVTTSAEYVGTPYSGNTGPHDRTDEPRNARRAADPGAHDDYATPGRPLQSRAGLGPRDYRRTDARVLEDVCERLTEDARVDASDIDVEVADGEVMLSGSVPTRTMKRAAEDCVERCRGVRDVHNRLRIDPTAERRTVNPTRPERDDAGD